MNEIERLSRKVKSAGSGRLEVVFLTGERGIGKSSLASMVKALAERQYQMIGLHTFVGAVTSIEELVRRVLDRLVKDGAGTSWFERIRSFFGNRIRQVDLFGIGVEFAPADGELGGLVSNFAPALSSLFEGLKEEKRGMLLVLDDMNGLVRVAGFPDWLKSLVDELATSKDSPPLCLLVVATEERRQELIDMQPSLARVFDLIEIGPWAHEETGMFFQETFGSAGIQIETEALSFLAQMAGGLPVLAHELGDAAYNIDTDNQIDEDDATAAVVQAADIVGRKYLNPQVLRVVRSPRYRSILRKIARKPLEFNFRRREVLERLSREEGRVFDNFLRRMRQLGVITTDPDGGPGAYRFVNVLHQVYFWLEAERAKGSRE